MIRMRHPLLMHARDLSPACLPSIDLHMHTDWTDGAHTIEAMHQAAVDAGLRRILFSEHARRSSTDWFPRFAAMVRDLPTETCHAMVGAEVKVVNFQGDIDLAPEVHRECEMVMASVHRFPGESGQIKGTTGGYEPDEAITIEYRLSCAAIENPAVTILGHPFGMSLSRFKARPPEALVRDLMRRCAVAGVGFEINSRYHTNPSTLLAWCQDEDGVISLGSNAHETGEVGAILRSLTPQPQ